MRLVEENIQGQFQDIVIDNSPKAQAIKAKNR